MRLFIAVPLPYVFHSHVLGLQKELDSFGKIRLVEPENVHLTLKFLGNVDEDKTEVVKEKLAFLRDKGAFHVSLCGLGAFPGSRKPRVIWIGVRDGFEELTEMQKEIDSKLKDSGFKRDARFHPHYTLARVKFINNKEKMTKFLKKNKGMVCGNYSVDRILLMESQLSPKGPTYSVVEEYRLRE